MEEFLRFQSLIGFWVVFGCLDLDGLKYEV
jgi:hypothetical protein